MSRGPWNWVAEPAPYYSDVDGALVDQLALVVTGGYRPELPELAEAAFALPPVSAVASRSEPKVTFRRELRHFSGTLLGRTLVMEGVTVMSRIVIITGGSSGIGRALGAALVARGDDVVLAARTEADLQRTADELNAQGPGKARGSVLDVRNADEVTDLVNDVYDNYGRLDLMINNAGIGVIGFAHELTLDYWERIYDTNVRGVLHGVLAAYPIMIKQGRGQIANTASLAGLLPSPLQGPYTMTKHAVVGLTMSLRVEAQAHGVRVNLICPGVIETPLLDKGGPPGLPPTPHAFADARRLLGHATHSAPYPAARLAREVLGDLDKDRPIIVRPSSARWLWWLYRLSPRIAETYGRSYVRWATEHMSATRGLDELIPGTQP